MEELKDFKKKLNNYFILNGVILSVVIALLSFLSDCGTSNGHDNYRVIRIYMCIIATLVGAIIANLITKKSESYKGISIGFIVGGIITFIIFYFYVTFLFPNFSFFGYYC